MFQPANMTRLSLALLAVALVPAVLAECPPLSELPILWNSDTFLCAKTYQGPGGTENIQVFSWKYNPLPYQQETYKI